MITLQQNQNYLIGSENAIEALANKNQARILTISDTHGDSDGLLKIISRFGPDCDGLLIAGDCSHDLCELLTTAKKDENIKSVIPPVLGFVKGNGDPEFLPTTFNTKDSTDRIPIPLSLEITICGQKFYLCHGHLHGIDFGYDRLGLEAKIRNTKYIIHGHTHVAVCKKFDDFTFINPGSISRPRGGQPKGFAIITVGQNFVDTAFLEIKNSFGPNDSYGIYNPIF